MWGAECSDLTKHTSRKTNTLLTCTFFAAQIEKHSEVNQAREGSVETDLSCVLTALSLPFEKCPEVGVGHKSVWKAWSSLYAAVASNVSLVMNYKVCCSNDLFLSMNHD